LPTASFAQNAQEKSKPVAAPRQEAVPPPPVKVNKSVPAVRPPSAFPQFSASPTDQEIFQARVFDEPLVPMSGVTSATENRDLSESLLAYLKGGNPEDASAIWRFLRENRRTPWRASLLTNLGVVYRRTGYYSKALAAWQEAWALAKTENEPRAKATADRALGELVELNARLGRYEALEVLFAETADRDVRGSATEQISGAKQGLWMMQHRPGVAFRCGPLAVGRLLTALRPHEEGNPKIRAAESTRMGTSLSAMKALADDVGLKMQMAFRPADAPVLSPAMVHWKAGHFAALLRQEGGRYLLHDPTFGNDLWVTLAALNEEGTGYFLVPDGPLPQSWRSVGEDEGRNVWGKGYFGVADGTQIKPCSKKTRPDCNCHCAGMADYNVHAMLVSLNISDTPVGYSPPVGPAVRFQVTYNQRDSFQPQIFSYSNLGPKWTFDWMSYVVDNPASPGGLVNVYMRGGGQENPNGSGQPDPDTFALVTLTSTSPIQYVRALPDGSSEVFSQPDGAATYPRRVFMTQWIDPQGNSLSFTYDATLRLVAVTDAIEQVTTLSYDPLPADPLKIRKVTDPFGRFATFDYNSSGELSRITDTIGITSDFSYGGGDFINSLTTPYGATSFSNYDVNGVRRIQITDPLGGTELVEAGGGATLPPSDPPGTVPTGMWTSNANMNFFNTFYWDKRAMALYPGDYTKAQVFHWVNQVGDASSATYGWVQSEKRPLENRLWYAYPGQSDQSPLGSSYRPSDVGRVLDDGTTQRYHYEYNSIGKKTKEIDPLGRETDYFYGTNNVIDPNQTTGTGIDLLQVKQKNGAGFDLLQNSTYNSQHEPLTVIDASGQTTTYTYNAQGQIATVTTPPRAGITENRTTTYTYYPDTAPTGAGRVQTVTGPATGATTTYEYDAFGRVSRVTDSEGYAINTAYDALDRPTTVTYPDGTYEQTIYNRLDAEQRRDRLGRWTRRFYDALRRVVAMRDTQGHTTTYVWCNCGSLDAIRDGNGNTTSWQRDVQGRPTQETRADNSLTTSIYENTTSRLKSVTDARNQTKTYGYAIDNKLTSTTYTNFVVATPTVTFSYMDPDNPSVPDPYGRLRLMTDGIGTTRYDYKPVATLGAGSLSSVDGPLANDTVSYTYDERGRVKTRGLSTFSTTSGYDALGRLGTFTSPMGDFVWAYVNTTGRPQTATYPNGQTTTYTYFPNLGDQRLQQIKHQQTSGGTVLSQFDYTYDAVGNIKTWTQLRGTDPAKLYTLGYDPADEISTATVTGPTPLPVPSRFRYAYDSAGNRSAEEQDDAVTGATYNNLNQLTSRQPGGTVLFRGTVSEPVTVTVQGKPAQVASDNSFAAQAQVGSLDTDVAVAATDPSGNTRTNTYRVSQSGSTTTYTYDANGNLAGDGTRTFEWDAENRLTAVKQGGTTLASFSYDGKGRRAQKITGGVTHTYVYDGMSIVEERLSSGQTYDFVQGPGVDRPLAMRDQASVVSYYLADHLGSIAQTTSTAAAVTLTREYDPWGNPIQGSTTAGYAFTGREWDSEINAYYYRARYYDPKVGRFLSEDALGFKENTNFYGYVRNNPTRFTDPSGQSVADCFMFWSYWGNCEKEVECCVKNLLNDFDKMTLEQQVLWLEAHGVNFPSDAAFKECFISNANCQKMLEYAPKCATTIPFGGWFTRIRIIQRIRSLP